MTRVSMDWSLPEEQPGIRTGTVSKVAHVEPTGGDARLEVDFSLEGGGSIRDYIMLEGRAKGMGIVKLERLGIAKGSDYDTDDLIGRKIPLVLILNEWQGRTRLQVDAKANVAPYRVGYGEMIGASKAASAPARSPADAILDGDNTPF